MPAGTHGLCKPAGRLPLSALCVSSVLTDLLRRKHCSCSFHTERWLSPSGVNPVRPGPRTRGRKGAQLPLHKCLSPAVSKDQLHSLQYEKSQKRLPFPLRFIDSRNTPTHLVNSPVKRGLLLPMLQMEKLRPRSSPLREIARILTRLPELQSPILLACLFRDSHLTVFPG